MGLVFVFGPNKIGGFRKKGGGCVCWKYDGPRQKMGQGPSAFHKLILQGLSCFVHLGMD